MYNLYMNPLYLEYDILYRHHLDDYIEENHIDDLRYEKPLWIQKFSKVFESCPEHSLRHTHEEYERACNRSLSLDYRILECVGSGSIGQVYKVQDIHTTKLYAMKIIHPGIEGEIKLFERLYYLIHGVLCFYYGVHDMVPLNIPSFISVFKEQSNFIKEEVSFLL